jgi:hypothetical protein
LDSTAAFSKFYWDGSRRSFPALPRR